VRTLVILAAIYWGFKLFSRYVAPFILKRMMGFVAKKAEQNMRNQSFNGFGGPGGASNNPFGGQNEDPPIRQTKKKQPPRNYDGVGEYVDFEEVD
jgi:hypothetical protein